MSDKIVFGDIARKFLPEFIQTYNPCKRIIDVLTTLSLCGTEALGCGSYHCYECGHEGYFNLSCRDRHCPSCHTHHREQWMEDRLAELLPVQYFHVVFTIPDVLHPVMLGHMKEGYKALFKAAKDTLVAFGKDKNKPYKLQLGMTMVLHTWGSNLSYHPHLHVLVPGGGIDLKTGKWVNLKPVLSKPSASYTQEDRDEESMYAEEMDKGSQPFLFPVKALSRLFRQKFIDNLTKFCGYGGFDYQTRQKAYQKEFNVYAKAPATGPEQVLEYLSRYSYGIAISNSRIIGLNDNEEVVFKYKDYRDGGKTKVMSLSGVEFLRRFSMHILPKHFTRIRHCGFLAPSNRDKLRKIQEELCVLAEILSRKKENRALCYVPHCEKCQSRDIILSIYYKSKTSYSSVIAKIRSPDSLQIAV